VVLRLEPSWRNVELDSLCGDACCGEHRDDECRDAQRDCLHPRPYGSGKAAA